MWHCFCRSLHIPSFTSKLLPQRDVEIAGTTFSVKCSTETFSIACLGQLSVWVCLLQRLYPVNALLHQTATHTFSQHAMRFLGHTCTSGSKEFVSISDSQRQTLLCLLRAASLSWAHKEVTVLGTNLASDHHRADFKSSHLKNQKEALSP